MYKMLESTMSNPGEISAVFVVVISWYSFSVVADPLIGVNECLHVLFGASRGTRYYTLFICASRGTRYYAVIYFGNLFPPLFSIPITNTFL